MNLTCIFNSRNFIFIKNVITIFSIYVTDCTFVWYPRRFRYYNMNNIIPTIKYIDKNYSVVYLRVWGPGVLFPDSMNILLFLGLLSKLFGVGHLFWTPNIFLTNFTPAALWLCICLTSLIIIFYFFFNIMWTQKNRIDATIITVIIT